MLGYSSRNIFFCITKIPMGAKVNFYQETGLFIYLNTFGPRQANLVLIAYASSEGSGEPAHPRSLARTFAARSYKQWVKRNLQTESQIPGPSEWLVMRSWNLSWRNARRHKFAWRGSFNVYIFKKTKLSPIVNGNIINLYGDYRVNTDKSP